MLELQLREVRGVTIAVLTVRGPLSFEASLATLARARKQCPPFELWDLRAAVLDGWDQDTTWKTVERLRPLYAPRTRAAVLARTRLQFTVATMVKSVVDDELVPVDIAVFVEEGPAVEWLVSEDPPRETSTIPAPAT